MIKNEARNVTELLTAARSIAELASAHGVLTAESSGRPQSDHLGAILADAVLQAGLNYSTVVRPRVERIMREYPEASCMSQLLTVIASGSVSQFLNWTHRIKVDRFINLVTCLNENNISNAQCLKINLSNDTFRNQLKSINGIGPKTIDYMACLVGLDNIAVDRHVRSFAKNVGLLNDEYEYLKVAFSYAADLLAVPRREFDAWIWRSYARSNDKQQAFPF